MSLAFKYSSNDECNTLWYMHELSKDTLFLFISNLVIVFYKPLTGIKISFFCMTPRHLEVVLYLRVNRHLWNEGTIQAIMDRPQPAPVVVEVEEMREVN
jgi:hypothetical protein